jgi:predicted AlkP superfamily phosphohydrolase/phosphomutase
MTGRVLSFILVVSAAVSFSCGSPHRTRVVVIGMDGLTPQLLFPWARSGRLPNFQRLLENGASGTLTSVVPPYSAQAWTSCITGVNPGKHGVHGFVESVEGDPADRGSAEMTFSSSLTNRAKTIWEILGTRNKRVIEINTPLSAPPFEINGLMISGFPQPVGAPFTYPPDLEERIPRYRPDSYGEEVRPGEEKRFLAELYDISQKREDTALRLLEEEDWDFFMVVFTITDRIQHYFWKYMDEEHPHHDRIDTAAFGNEVERVYAWMDEVLGAFLEQIDSDTYLIVMSDHGFRPVRKQVYGEVFLERVNTDSVFTAYATENFGATFRVKPRFPVVMNEGLENERRRFVDRLADELRSLEDPRTGKRIVRRVIRKEDAYHGDYLFGAPDVIGLEEEGYLFLNWVRPSDAPLVQEVPYARFFSGHHQLDGILLLGGPGVRKGVEITGAGIMDIAPTALALLDVPADVDMDGRVLTEAFPPGRLDVLPRIAYDVRPDERRFVLGDSMATAGEIEEQLKAIGYIQ